MIFEQAKRIRLCEVVMHSRPRINSKEASRQWFYICERAGKENAYKALARVPADRYPFPAAVAEVLRITLPDAAQLPWTPAEKSKLKALGRDELSKIRDLLGMPARTNNQH